MANSSNIGSSNATTASKPPASASSKQTQTGNPPAVFAPGFSAPSKEAQQAKQTQAQPQAQNPFNTPNSALNPQVQFQASQAMQQSKAGQPNASGGSRPVKTATIEIPARDSSGMDHALGIRAVLQQANPSNPNAPITYDMEQRIQFEPSPQAYQSAKATEEAKAQATKIENASLSTEPRKVTPPFELTPQSIKEFNDRTENDYVQGLDDASKTLQLALSEQPRPEVINLSVGKSQNSISQNIYQELRFNPAKGALFGLTPEDVQKSLEPLDPNNQDPDNPTLLAQQKVIGGIQNHLTDLRQKMEADPNSRFNQALREYQDTTKAAADQGTAIVVASSNDNIASSPFGKAQSLGSDTSPLIMSDHVIAVGNYDEHTHKMASNSSQGNGRFNPAVVAPGVDVDVPDQANPGHTKKESGTSISAPKVAGTVAEMKAANPNLTFDQIKDLLRQSATDVVPGEIADGAGLYDPAKAIQLAKETLTTK